LGLSRAMSRIYARTTARETFIRWCDDESRREQKMLGFKSPASAQRFLSIHAAVRNAFNLQRHLIFRRSLRLLRAEAAEQWQIATAAA